MIHFGAPKDPSHLEVVRKWNVDASASHGPVFVISVHDVILIFECNWMKI